MNIGARSVRGAAHPPETEPLHRETAEQELLPVRHLPDPLSRKDPARLAKLQQLALLRGVAAPSGYSTVLACTYAIVFGVGPGVKLLKIGAQVRRSVHWIKIATAAACPYPAVHHLPYVYYLHRAAW